MKITFQKRNKREKRIPIVFDDMIVGVRCNKKLSPNVTELFSRGMFYLNILLVFISHRYYFKVPKTVRLNPTHYFIIKTPNKRKRQPIA